MAPRRVTARSVRTQRAGARPRRPLDGRAGRSSGPDSPRRSTASPSGTARGRWFPLNQEENTTMPTTTTTENGMSEQALDRAIERIESLYRTVTGHDVPPPAERGHGGIPPE